MTGVDAKKILVVDDEQDLVQLMTFTLEGEGHLVESASDGVEGLEVLSRGLPDLILLDMKMPRMNGWEFAAEFHARYDGQVPILLITASADPRSLTREVGAQGWIGKPFDLDDLVRIVKRQLEARGG